ncbi:MAG: hypothetical protein GF307_10650 [candidate division Zixibacteria bacterium]|nr:hypothetical protein [candidate division Zixibacteria bacterium]
MIKRVLLILLLASLIMPASGHCWVQSFRWAASGNLLYGDFDNDLDPIYIWDNQGYRLYTTLSNLSSSSDMLFSDVSDGVYLFGASGKLGIPEFMGWENRSMLLIQLADTRSDLTSGLDTDFDGTVDLTDTGYQSGNYTRFFDMNNDNIFDTRAVYLSSADNYDILKKRDWHFTHGMRKGRTKLGISFDHLGYGNNYSEQITQSNLFNFVTPSHDYSYSKSLTLTDLSNSSALESRAEQGAFKTTLETPINIFNVSYESPFRYIDNSDLRLDLIITNGDDQMKTNDYFSYSRDVSGGGITDINRMSESAYIDSTQGGSTFALGAMLSKYWNYDFYSWFRINAGIGSFDANRDYANNYDMSRRLTDVQGNLTVYTRDYTHNIIREGDTKRKFIRFYHKSVVEFTRDFVFSAGLDFQYISDETDWTERNSLLDVMEYDNGDGASDRSDSTVTITESHVCNLLNKTKRTEVMLPVAMEYSLGKWTFRVGAIHAINKITSEEDGIITDSDPRVTRIVYGDGDSTVTVSDDDYLSTRTATETRTHTTHYVYGVEFNANKHLKAELLGFLSSTDTEFLNTDFYRQLRISLTVLF